MPEVDQIQTVQDIGCCLVKTGPLGLNQKSLKPDNISRTAHHKGILVRTLRGKKQRTRFAHSDASKSGMRIKGLQRAWAHERCRVRQRVFVFPGVVHEANTSAVLPGLKNPSNR